MALIQCKECGKEISSEAKVCPHCGYKEKKAKGTAGKKVIIAVCLTVSLVLGFLIYRVASSAWMWNVELKYVDTHTYEITNTSNKTLKDVYAVIKVEGVNKSFKYEDYVVYNISPGETIEYSIDWDEVENEAEKSNATLFLSTAEISKLKYR